MKKSLLFFGSIVLIVLSCRQTVNNSDTSGNWVYNYQIGGFPRSGAVSFVIGDTGYIATGYNSYNDSCLSDLWQFDPSGTGNWTQKAYLPGSPRHSAVGFAIAQKGYISTGYNAKTTPQNFQDTWEYDPATNTWLQKADLPNISGAGARKDAVAFSIGGVGYVGTGYNGTWLKDFYSFDPLANKWTVIPNIPGNKRAGSTAFVHDTLAYICLGSNSSGVLNDFWQFNSVRKTWKKLNDISNTSSENFDDEYTDIMRDHAVSFVMPDNGVDKAYITCGQSGSPLKTTWEYDFASDRWARKAPFEKQARTDAVSWSFLKLKRAFIGTGSNSNLSLDDYYEFFPAATANPND